MIKFVSSSDYLNWDDSRVIFINGAYLHGSLQRFFGDDCIGYVLDSDKIEFGISECEVIGYSKPCRAYFWRIPENQNEFYRGIIIDPDSQDDLEYANQKFRNKPDWL